MPSSNEKPIRVAVAVVEHQGRYLIGIRPAGVPLAGLSEFPGGKVLPDETLAAAAIRECREESGLQVEVTGEMLSTTHRYDHGLLEIHFFRCRPVDLVDSEPAPRPPFRWVSADELATLNFPAANARLTEMLLREAAK